MIAATRSAGKTAVDLGSRLEADGEQVLLGVLLGQVENYRHGLREDELAVDQHRDLPAAIA